MKSTSWWATIRGAHSSLPKRRPRCSTGTPSESAARCYTRNNGTSMRPSHFSNATTSGRGRAGKSSGRSMCSPASGRGNGTSTLGTSERLKRLSERLSNSLATSASEDPTSRATQRRSTGSAELYRKREKPKKRARPGRRPPKMGRGWRGLPGSTVRLRSCGPIQVAGELVLERLARRSQGAPEVLLFGLAQGRKASRNFGIVFDELHPGHAYHRRGHG